MNRAALKGIYWYFFSLPNKHRIKNEEGHYRSGRLFCLVSSAGTVILVKKIFLSVQVLPGKTRVSSCSKSAFSPGKAILTLQALCWHKARYSCIDS